MLKIIPLLLLVGCTTLSTGEINTKPVNNTTYITWIRINDPMILHETCKKIGVRTDGLFTEIAACATFNIQNHTCTIYSPNPQKLNDASTTLLGHEALHCFDGNFHK